MVICPRCGRMNEDNWPLRIDKEIKMGGCLDCFEKWTDETQRKLKMDINQNLLR